MIPINTIMAYITITCDKRHLLITAITFLMLIGFVPESWGQTTIVACRNASEILIGADSLVGKGTNSPPMDCKVRQVNEFFIAFAGLPFIEVPPPIRFNIVDLFRESCKTTSGPLSAKVQTLAQLVKPTLSSIAEFVRMNYHEAFKIAYARDDKILLSIIIGGVEENMPVFFALEYQIITPDGQPVELKQTFWNPTYIIPVNEPDFAIFGEHLAIDELIKKEGRPTICDPTILQKWIALEAVDRPDRVGLPVDIVRITPRRAEWIQRKPECPEIQDYSK